MSTQRRVDLGGPRLALRGVGPKIGVDGTWSFEIIQGETATNVAQVTMTGSTASIALIDNPPSRVIGALAQWALDESANPAMTRVELHLALHDEDAQRAAVWAGMRREGIRREVGVPGGARVERVVLARLRGDPSISEPDGFRSLLNAWLPRKRVIAQFLIRDPEHRVLLCGLTYKPDWDLPGGVVESGESPGAAVAREVSEELGLQLEAGPLLVADWLPPWRGWDDAMCLVFDGGVHEVGLLDQVRRQEREIAQVDWLSPQDVAQRATDFTARRIAVARQRALDGAGATFTESGHPR